MTAQLTPDELRLLQEDKNVGHTANQAKEIYDKCAAAYECEFEILDKEIQLFIEKAGLQEDESVLDLGCGNGFLTLGAKMRVGHGTVVGVDISTEMLKFANRRRVEGMHFLAGDIEHLDEVTALLIHVPTGKFDVILCRRVLYNIHQSKQTKAIQHWATFLAPGGRLVMDQAHEYRHLAQIRAIKSNRTEAFVHMVAQPKERVQCRVYAHRQVQDAGLKLVSWHDLMEEGIDKGPEFLARAEAAWKKSRRAGKMPDVFFENCKRAEATEQQRKMIAANGQGWSGFSMALVAVLVVIKNP